MSPNAFPSIAVLLAACTAPKAPADSGDTADSGPRGRWTPEQAWAWSEAGPWPVGVNYAPRTASNQLEMWQAATWDPDTIDQELGWAQDLGLNVLRVFLHDLAWEQDPEGFLDRVDALLAMADAHDQRVLLVIFDGVWDPFPVAGVQAEPVPGVHNSRWVQSPGAAILGDDAAQEDLEPYVRAVVGRFAQDERVFGWDLFNEADNANLGSYRDVDLPIADKTDGALALMERSMAWARDEGPVQPLTIGAYNPARSWAEGEDLAPITAFMLHESDVPSFHSYERADAVRGRVETLSAQGRPILCTEYMGRPTSTLQEILPVFQETGTGAFSWGLVAGRTQTIWPWTTWASPGEGDEPEVWFHDLLRADGTPWSEEEAEFLRGLL